MLKGFIKFLIIAGLILAITFALKAGCGAVAPVVV